MDKIGLAPVVFVIRHRMSQHYDVTVLFHFSGRMRKMWACTEVRIHTGCTVGYTNVCTHIIMALL